MGEPVNPPRIHIPSLFSLFLALATLLNARQVHAGGDAAACKVRIIHAKHEGSTFDPQLEPLRPQLTQPPLSAWKSFTLLGQHDLPLHILTPSNFAVPGGHEGRLEFVGTVEGHGRQRLRLRWQIFDGDARLLSTVFVINDGGTVLQAGIKHDHGLLVLGLTCKLGS
jgi:hypothetical protein